MKFILSALLLIASMSSFAQTAPKLCAKIFNSLDHDFTSSLSINDGQAIYDLGKVALTSSHGDWDNKITKIIVKKDCTLVGYQYLNFNKDFDTGYSLNGFAELFENNSRREYKRFVLDGYANDRISSLKCFCF